MSDLLELTREECEAILRRGRIGRLAVAEGNVPYVVPVSFVFADDAIYGHTSPGHKLTLLRGARACAILVDEIQDFAVWSSVLARGRWNELTDDEGTFRARSLILARFGDPWWATAGHGHRTTLADAVFYRVDIESLTGRSQNA